MDILFALLEVLLNPPIRTLEQPMPLDILHQCHLDDVYLAWRYFEAPIGRWCW